MIGSYEGTYPTKIEAENAAFRLKLMGYKTLIKKNSVHRWEVFSNA